MRTVIFGLLIPFVGTAAGAACVFFLKKDLRAGIQRALTGFAAGVMVAASIWSLIIPAIEQSEAMERFAFMPAFAGFWIGILFLLLLDHVIPHLHRNIDLADQSEGPKSRLSRTVMMVLAVTLHNIPEGMAVGVVYAGLLSDSPNITAGGALALALGIAIQN
ncbi:MAG: ZIP family metal transporter, partial [Clostridiales bacterium]|nr:ZIP family metal transporter [Clostridiales bacterium]